MLAEELHPFTAASGRFAIASLVPVTIIYPKEGNLPRISIKQWGAMLLLGFFGVFSYNVLFFMGLKTVEASRGAMIIAANPVITILLAIVLGERFNLIRSLGILISILGAVTVIAKGDIALILQGNIGLGELYMVGCVLSGSAYALIDKRQLAKISPLTAVTYSCCTGTLLLIAATVLTTNLVTDPPHLSTVGWFSLFYLALCGTALGFIWFYQGVQQLGAGHASIYVNLVPISGVLLGILLLGEQPDLSLLISGGLVLSGLYLINRRTRVRTRDKK